MIGVFWGLLSLLVLGAALRLRARLREPLRQGLLDDDAVRAIESVGRLEVDDAPLDPSEIEEEERRFWEEEEWE